MRYDDYEDYSQDEDGSQQQETSEAERYESERANAADRAYDDIRNECWGSE